MTATSVEPIFITIRDAAPLLALSNGEACELCDAGAAGLLAPARAWA